MDLALSDLVNFNIKPVHNQRLQRLILRKLELSAEELPTAGAIEKLAFRTAHILNSVNPRLRNPAVFVFAGDHGIAYPLASFLRDEQSTSDDMLKLLHSQLSVNTFATNSGLDVKLLDFGTDHNFEGSLSYWLHHGTKFFNRKQAFGSRSFHEFPAMTTAEVQNAMQDGMAMIDRERKSGCNVLTIGHLGKGGKYSAWCLAATLMDVPLREVIGNEDETLISFLDKAIKIHPKTHDALTLLSLYGGYEIAAMTGAILRAAYHRMVVLIDGTVSIATLLLASKINERVVDYAIPTHNGMENAHDVIRKYLGLESMMNIPVQSKAGSGAAFAFPLIQNAVSLISSKSSR